MMENANCDDESICSVDKESILVEHDYCRSAITCDTLDKKDDHALAEKFTISGVEKLTDGQCRSVQVSDVDDRNEIVAKDIAVQKLHCHFVSEKEIREKVHKKFGFPAVMGDFFSRASKKLDELIPESLSKGHKKSSTRTVPPGMAARRDEKLEMTSRERSVFEAGASSSHSRQNVTEDSGMISHGSDLSESITPDFELPRDVPMQSRPDLYLLTPADPAPGPTTCRQAIAPVEADDASIHSQPTQILAGVCELPDFRLAFGSLMPSNFSNNSSPPPTSTPNYQLSDSQRTAFAGAPEAREGVVEQTTQHENTSDCSPPSLPPNCILSDGERVEFLSDGNVELGTPYEGSNCSSPELFSTENYPSDRQGPAFTDTSDRQEAVDDIEAQFENSNCDSPELLSTENYPPLDRQGPAFIDMSDRQEADDDLEAQFENSNCDSPELLSTENYPPLDRQGAVFTDTSDRQAAVDDIEAQYENSNSASPELFSDENYPPSNRQKTALTDTSDTRAAVIDFEIEHEISDSGSTGQFSNTSSTSNTAIRGSPVQWLRVHYPSLNTLKPVFIDTWNRRRTVNDFEVLCENSNSVSPDLFSTENCPPSDIQGTAVTDTSDAQVAVVDLVSQQENSTSCSPEQCPTHPLSDRQGAPFTDTSDRQEAVSDIETQYENSDSVSPELFSNENYPPSGPNSNSVSPDPFSNENYPSSDSQETAVTDTSGAQVAVVDLVSHQENSTSCSPEQCATHPLSDRQGAPFTDTTDRQEAVNDIETQYENSDSVSPELFSNENYAPSASQRTALTDKKDTRLVVIDHKTQNENSNPASPGVFSDENYPPSNRQKTAFTDTSDTRAGVIDFEIEREISDSGSPGQFSNTSSTSNTAIRGSPVQWLRVHYPSLNTLKPVFIDTWNRRGTVNNLEMQYENSNSVSPDLFSTENCPPSDIQGTAVTDTSDAQVAVIDLISQEQNSNSDSPELFSNQHPLSVRQDAAVIDASDRRDPLSDRQETVLTDASDNSSALTQVLRRSPSLDITPSITPEEFIDPKTKDDNLNTDNSEVAQSTINDLELMDTQQVIDGATHHEYSNDSKVIQSAPADSKLPDIQRAIDRKIADETSTQSITQFLDTRCSVDNYDLPTQICTPFCDEGNENRIAINEQTPNSSRGLKRKREPEPESLWTVVEEFSESGSPELGVANSLRQLSTVGNADPRRISIGTNLPTPEFLKAPKQNLDNVSLDHSYSEPTKKSSEVRTLEFEGSQSKSYRSVAESVPSKIGKIRAIKKFSGSDSSNTRNFEQRPVRKTSKRKIDFDDCKENWPLKKRRVRESSTPHRSIFDSNKSLDSSRLNLNDPHETHCSGSLDFSELLSNRCSEYDHTFPNLTSLENAPYVPILLKHLVETSYVEIKRNIDELVRCFEVSDEDF